MNKIVDVAERLTTCIIIMDMIRKPHPTQRIHARRRKQFPSHENSRLYKVLDRIATRYWKEVRLHTYMSEQHVDAVALINGNLIVIDFYGAYGAYSPPRVREANIERLKVADLYLRNKPFCRLRRKGAKLIH